MSLFRLLLSRILNAAFGRLLSMPIRDLSTGFRLYHRKVLTSLRPVACDFDFLQEVLILVYRQGWRVKETPFHYASRGAGKSHARLLHSAGATRRACGGCGSCAAGNPPNAPAQDCRIVKEYLTGC